MPVMGITRIANVTGLDRIGIPVVMVPRPNSRCLSVAQGKGLDLDAARASGLMEAVETYHAERITLPLKLCSYEELRYTHRVADVTALPILRDALFDGELPLLWIEGHDLLQDEGVWVPFDLVHTSFTITRWRGPATFAPTTNGLASGNHLTEAISHGICEVVERDAAALWALRGEQWRDSSRIALDTVDDPGARSVLERLEAAGIDVAVWEITSDVGIPAFRCTITDRQDTPLHRLYPSTGTGCHPTRSIALLRALTEAVQSRLTAIAGSRDDIWREEYEGFQERHPAPLLPPPDPLRPYPGVSREAETFEEDVAWELDRLRDAGIDRVIVVDLTMPQLGLPVVRVVIPGLEPLDRHGAYRHGRRALQALAGGT